MKGVRLGFFAILVTTLLVTTVLFSQDPATEPATTEDKLKVGLQTTFGSAAVLEVALWNQTDLRIRTGLPVISDEAYRRLLVELCALLVSTEDADYEAIRFVNSIEKQGFIYKAPGDCSEVIEKSEKEGKQLIFTQTDFCQGRC